MLTYLGPAIRERRKEKEYKVYELAERVGVAAVTITMIEKCQRLPSEEVLKRIIKVLERDFKTEYYKDKYADVIMLIKDNPAILIEVKRPSSEPLTQKDLSQLRKYLSAISQFHNR